MDVSLSQTTRLVVMTGHHHLLSKFDKIIVLDKETNQPTQTVSENKGGNDGTITEQGETAVGQLPQEDKGTDRVGIRTKQVDGAATIIAYGSYAELVKRDDLKTYIMDSQTTFTDDTDQSSITRAGKVLSPLEQKEDVLSTQTSLNEGDDQKEGHQDIEELTANDNQDDMENQSQTPSPSLIDEDDMSQQGAIRLTHYAAYLRGGGGICALVSKTLFLIIVAAMAQLLRVTVDYWLVLWAEDADTNHSPINSTVEALQFRFGSSSLTSISPSSTSSPTLVTLSTQLTTILPSNQNTEWWEVSTAVVIAACLFFLILRLLAFILIAIQSSTSLHNTTFARVIRAPLYFFDSNPQGRILNRFTTDTDILDTRLPTSLMTFIEQVLTLLGIAGLAIAASPWVLVPLIPASIYALYFQRMFRLSSTQLRRIQSASLSPLLSTLSTVFNGHVSLRAFSLQSFFIHKYQDLVNRSNIAFFTTQQLQRWLGVRLDFACSLVVLGVGLSCVLTRDLISPKLAGLALVYVMQVVGLLQWAVTTFVTVESSMTSVERLREYAQLSIEQSVHTSSGNKHKSLPEGDNDDKSLTVEPTNHSSERTHDEILSTHTQLDTISINNWPSHGEIQFNHLSLRYHTSLPKALHDVTFTIPSGTKVGVVGRTGSGKSSLLLALLRIIEPSSGSIIIDGIDISTIPLDKLRGSISIIPQQPVLFSGTIRYNLDPFIQHSDAKIWTVLNQGRYFLLHYYTCM